MSSLATGIREEGWRIDAATGVKRPSELNVGDLIALLSGTYGDRLKYNLLTNKTELDNVVIEDEQKTYFYLQQFCVPHQKYLNQTKNHLPI